jgi:hypothetical protein
MSVKSFIPEYFSTSFEDAFRKKLVFGSFCNRKYEGVIAQAGDTVKVPVIGDININTYVQGVDLVTQAISGSTIEIKADQYKYFDFAVDDVDRMQALVNVEQVYGEKAGYKVADTIDSAIAGLYTEAGSTVGTTSVPISITAAASTGGNIGIYEAIGDVKRYLDDKNVSEEGRWIALPSWAIQKLSLAGKLGLGTTDQQAYVNGMVTRIDGMTVYHSNNVVNGTAAVASKIMAGTNDAIAMVSQLTQKEAVRAEKSFSDIIRGLTVYGLKVIQPDALVCATWSRANG